MKRQTVNVHGDGMVSVSGLCFVTHKPYTTARFPKRELDRWLAGEYAQDALRSLGAGDREFLISGTSPEGWDMIFPPDEGVENEEAEER